MTIFYRFFARETHSELEEIIKLLSSSLHLSTEQWTIKQQAASYQQAYRYVAQGHGITLSFYEHALKEKERGEQTELIVACENAPWLTLLAQTSSQEPSTYRLDVQTLPANPKWEAWELKTNQTELAQELLSLVEDQLSIFKKLEAVEFTLERQRLYVKWLWLPDTIARQEQLKETLCFAKALTTALDVVPSE